MRSMASFDAVSRLGRYFLPLLWMVNGARISSRISQNFTGTSGVIPDGEAWEKENLYVCMQKYQSGGAFSSFGGFVDQFCLANLETALDTATAHLKFSPSLDACEAPKELHRFKLCPMKGRKPEGRISYTKKTHVPKSCFRASNAESAYVVIEAAVDENECRRMAWYGIDRQAVLGEAPTTTTTTSTTSSVFSDEDEREDDTEVECYCNTGFLGEIENKTCTCKPAPCEVVGSVGSGPECACLPGLQGEIAWDGPKADGECIAEIKDLFTEGEEFLWQYEGKSIKCCISSKPGKPSYLQDMTADVLPAKGSFGRWRSTGCGYMFGDSYHNGLKGHKGAYLTCPIAVTQIMALTGKSFDAIRDIIGI